MTTLIDAVVADPLLVAAALPLATGVVVAALVRLIVDSRYGGLATAGALLAFLLVFLLSEGVPPLIAVTAKQKLFWLAVAGGIAGAVAWTGRRAAIERALLVLLPAIGLIWLGERQWAREPGTGFVLLSLCLWAGTAAVGLRLRVTRAAGHGFTGGVQLVVAAAALSVIALIGASASLATLTGALAAGLGGVLLINYLAFLSNRIPAGLGPIGRLGLLTPLGTIAAILVLFVDGVSLIAVALVALIFLSGRIPLWTGSGAMRLAPVLEPVRATFLALVLATLAIGVALLEADMTGYP